MLHLLSIIVFPYENVNSTRMGFLPLLFVDVSHDPGRVLGSTELLKNPVLSEGMIH